jgi:hypothetical protein
MTTDDDLAGLAAREAMTEDDHLVVTPTWCVMHGLPTPCRRCEWMEYP